MSESSDVKIRFDLLQDEDGYPPVSLEMLNATEIGPNLYRVENAPFFMENVSYGDVVVALPTATAGLFKFKEVAEQSKFNSLSIIILDKSMDVFLMDLLRGLDCVIEYGEFGELRVLAVAVPESTDYLELRDQLLELEEKELISFAELAVSPQGNP